VDLEIPRGRIVALAGPSGAGKSTLLRSINRLLEPPRGTVLIGGDDVTTTDVVALRRRVGMVFQRPVALPGTVADNLRYGPRLTGDELSSGDVSALLEAAALAPDMGRRPAVELSGGEAQRMALARCLANDPQVLLLDEPTAALDPAARRAVGDTVAAVARDRGVTILWVTHDLDQALAYADELVLMIAGRIAAVGPPGRLLDDPTGPVARFARGDIPQAPDRGLDHA